MEKNIIIIAIIKNIKISRKIYVSMQFKSSFFKVKEALKLRIGCNEPIFRWSKFDKGSP